MNSYIRNKMEEDKVGRRKRSRRKRRNVKYLGIIIPLISIGVIGAAVFAFLLLKKEDTRKTPEELLTEYMSHIPKQEYEEM